MRESLRTILLVATMLFGVGVSAAERITHIHTDALGSPVAATDEQGNIIWREKYQPYGERLTNDPAALANQRWYTGHPQDTETGLVYAGARYYDPTLGRFMAVDPKPFSDVRLYGFNRYSYAANNPYKYRDPDGMDIVGSWEPTTSSAIGNATVPVSQLETWTNYALAASPVAAGRAVGWSARVLREALTEIGEGAARGLGQDISRGHAFEKHVLKGKEFEDLGIKSQGDFAKHIDKVVSNAKGANVRELSGGRTAYWDDTTGTVVIRNPKAADGGTAFRPTAGKKYFTDILR